MTKILEVDYKKIIIKGPLLKEDEKYFMIKLDSGYNANLLKKNCKIISESNIKETKVSSNQIKNKSNISSSNITILHTGGTIASKVDYRTGAVSSKFTPQELLGLFPELNEIANITTKLIGNIFSEDMRFSEYNLILKEIQLAINNKTDGIIIAHGTDTLHYTSAALQYATKNLNIPVLLVGAQRSSDRPSSDAFSNLNAAAQFIISQKDKTSRFNRVGICMHATTNDDKFSILDGINAKKMHSTQRDAFKQINYKPYCEMNVFKNNELTIFRKDLETQKNEITKEFSYTKFNEELKIGFFKVHPNMFDWELDNLLKYDAVIIEGTGIGNIPQNNNNQNEDRLILNKLKELCNKTKIFAGVQTVYGEISLDIYSRGKDMQNAGIIGNRINLTTESTFCRIAHVLSIKNSNFDIEWDKNHEDFKKISKQI